jgi:hypothetical protein
MLRGSTATTAGAGLVILAGAPAVDFWVDESGVSDVYCIAHAATATLTISFDSEP